MSVGFNLLHFSQRVLNHSITDPTSSVSKTVSSLHPNPASVKFALPIQATDFLRSLENVHLGMEHSTLAAHKAEFPDFIQPFQRLGFSGVAENSHNGTGAGLLAVSAS